MNPLTPVRAFAFALGAALLISTPASALDCLNPKEPHERVICTNSELAATHSLVTWQYGQLLRNLDRTKQRQRKAAAEVLAREFVTDRRKCKADLACLKNLYDIRSEITGDALDCFTGHGKPC
jgi:uncharacterized protein